MAPRYRTGEVKELAALMIACVTATALSKRWIPFRAALQPHVFATLSLAIVYGQSSTHHPNCLHVIHILVHAEAHAGSCSKHSLILVLIKFLLDVVDALIR